MTRRLKTLTALFLAAALVAPGIARAEELTVLLDWFVNPDHGPLIAGQAELAVSYQPQLHIQVDQGLPLARVATLVATPLSTLLALENGPVKSVADLKGRKVGFSVGGFEDAVLGAMLAKAGVDPKDVELINVNFALSPALLSGQVDAVIGAYRNFELNQLEIEGYQGRAFYPEEHGVPTYDELIVVAHRDRLEDPRIAAFIGAIERGVQYLINHPEESWEIFASYKAGLDDELNRRAWRDTLPRFALRPAALDRGRYERFARFLQERGLVEPQPPVESYAVE